MFKALPLVLFALSLGLPALAEDAAPQPQKPAAASPDHAAVLMKLANALEAAGRHDQAAAAYGKAADLYTAQAKALEKEAADLKAAGQEDAAKAKYGQVAEQYGLAADASEKQANILLSDLGPAPNATPIAPATEPPAQTAEPAATPATAPQPGPATGAPAKPVPASIVPPLWKDGPPTDWVKQQIVQRYTLGLAADMHATVTFTSIEWLAPTHGIHDMGAEKFMHHTNAPSAKNPNGMSYPLTANYTVSQQSINTITGQAYPPSVNTYERNYYCYVDKDNHWVVVMGPNGKPWPPK